ncbi:MAG: hypothetical protein GY810_19095 [Aureispira sp.]|nr:hypothetical protein [Aureispira sp.]
MKRLIKNTWILAIITGTVLYATLVYPKQQAAIEQYNTLWEYTGEIYFFQETPQHLILLSRDAAFMPVDLVAINKNTGTQELIVKNVINFEYFDVRKPHDVMPSLHNSTENPYVFYASDDTRIAKIDLAAQKTIWVDNSLSKEIPSTLQKHEISTIGLEQFNHTSSEGFSFKTQIIDEYRTLELKVLSQKMS